VVAGRPARIVIVRFSSLGDVALASVAVDALRHRGSVLFATRPAFADLFREDPRVDAVVATLPGREVEARDEIRAFRPTGVVDLQGTLRSRRLLRPFADLPRATVRKNGVARRLAVLGWRRGAKTKRVYERYLDAISAFTDAGETASPCLHISDDARARALETLGADAEWIGIAPGSRWANKRWPRERFLESARQVHEDTGCCVALFVGPTEDSLAAWFEERLREDRWGRIVSCSLGVLPAHLARLSVLITGDSGPMHVAEAVGTPVVALFGPTTARFGFAPFLAASHVVERSLSCRPCHVHGGNRCLWGHHRCMMDTPVTDVVECTHLARRARGASSAQAHQEGR